MGITKVKLRQRQISKERISLYLDFYPPIKLKEPIVNKNGELITSTRREFLGLHILQKPKTRIEKLDNKQTFLLAQQIRQKRDNEINKPEVYTAFELEQLRAKEKGALSFITYYEKQMEKRKGKNYDVWFSAFNYLKDFTGNDVKFADVDEKFCNDYKEYLLNTKSRRRTQTVLSQNSAHSAKNG